MQLYAMNGAADGCSGGNTSTTLHPSSSRLGDNVDVHVADDAALRRRRQQMAAAMASTSPYTLFSSRPGDKVDARVADDAALR